jgi:hypothetical protein
VPDVNFVSVFVTNYVNSQYEATDKKFDNVKALQLGGQNIDDDFNGKTPFAKLNVLITFFWF